MTKTDKRANRVLKERKKRPYVEPAIEEEAVFETLAAGCDFNTGACTARGGSQYSSR